jgi:septum formation protein
MTPVILASKSAARAQVLTGAGVSFQTAGSGVDEDAVKDAMLAVSEGPLEIARALAEAKALAVSQAQPGLVIGADQTLDLDGRLYDKAADIESARERLKLLRGQTHLLHGAVAVALNGQVIWRDVATASLTMRDFSDDFLEDYLATEGPHCLGSVGCYRLEGPGAQLFSRIDGDYFGILGLPLMGLLELLRGQGALLS